MAGKSFSVHVDIGGRLNASLGNAVRRADAQVSTLGRSIAAINTRTNETIRSLGTGLAGAGRKVQEVGRNFTTSVSAPTGVLAWAGGKMAFDVEKAGNMVQALGDATDEQRKKLEDYANVLNKKYPQSLSEIIKTGNEMLKGGFNFDQMMGSLDQTLATAVIGEIDPAAAGNMMSRSINSFQLPMATFDQALESSRRVSDLMTYAAVKTTASLRDMGETFRYVGGAVSATGGSIEDATALAMGLAKVGSVGSDAGVTVRSMIVRMVKMTDKGNAALNRIGMDLNKYVGASSRPLTSDRILAGLEGEGLDASAARAEIDGILKSKIGASRPKLTAAITKAVQDAIGSSSAIDTKAIAENVSDSIAAGGSNVDLIGFLTDLQEKLRSGRAGPGDTATIFEGRHFARISGLLLSDIVALRDQAIAESVGYTQDRQEIAIKGIVSPVYGIAAAMEQLSSALGRTVFPQIAEWLESLSSAVKGLSEANPKLLKFAAFTGLATIALGPFLVVAGGAARVVAPLAVGLLSLGRVATIGLATRLTAVAGAVRALAVASMLGAASRLRSMAAGLVMLSAVGGRGAILGAMAGSIAAFGRALVAFPGAALRGLTMPLAAIGGLSAAGLIAITGAFVALGVWVSNNWEGLKSFLSGFADKMRSSLSPQVVGAFDKVSSAIGSILSWVKDLLGPLQATNGEWRSWGETVGGAVAGAVNTVASAIETVIGLFSSAIEKAEAFATALSNISGNGPVGATAVGVGHAGSDPTRAIKAGDPAAKLLGSGAARLDGQRALGGPVRRGGSYLVGERGPEIFNPGQSGNIIPNNRINLLLQRAEKGATASRSPARSGNITLNAPITVNTTNGDPHEIARIARAEFSAEVRRMEARQRGFLSD